MHAVPSINAAIYIESAHNITCTLRELYLTYHKKTSFIQLITLPDVPRAPHLINMADHHSDLIPTGFKTEERTRVLHR